ncbi:MobC family plasmid mobilization relaxosome protein [Desulfosarcina sp. OttesenSCG-928-G17]|nr:MobC family plasmid mobilization relaxosome protein [Desulfosarcina sp. OttesenSCG-928-G17]
MNGRKKADRKKYFVEYAKKNRQIRITFSNADYEIIDAIAKKQGLQIASFVRYATMTQAKNLYLFPKNLEEQIKLAVRNMRGIGNNINQVAKYANKEGYASRDSMETIFNYLYHLEKEIKSMKEIVSKRE